jgi:hypothetical protein
VGTRGPIGKRDDQRIRRNKPDVPTEKVQAIGVVAVPGLCMPDAHPVTVDLYLSMQESAQARFFEASDWAYARFCLHFCDQLLKSSRPSGQTLSVVQSMLSELLVSEGSRRRLRIEVERSNGPGADVLDIADMFRRRLEQG